MSVLEEIKECEYEIYILNLTIKEKRKKIEDLQDKCKHDFKIEYTGYHSERFFECKKCKYSYTR